MKETSFMVLLQDIDHDLVEYSLTLEEDMFVLTIKDI